MTVIKTVTKKQFEEKFPDTYISDNKQIADYLENGTVLLVSEWNGEEYHSDGCCYKPIYEQVAEDEYNIVGYEKTL